MKIGFDGKRAFQNRTGLGNYTRSLITALAEYYPEHYYTLFAPKQTGLFDIISLQHVNAVTPSGSFYKRLGSLWRRSGMVKDIASSGMEIFHGVSNELPGGIQNSGVKTVVTIHDLIFERFPGTYPFDQRYTNRWKIKHACRIAHAVIAISQQTKNDLVNFYKVPAEKIFICYQTCNPVFQRVVSQNEKDTIKTKYQLPDKYFLFVSSIAPRKNLVAICRAMLLLKEKTDIPLVVIGDGKKQKQEVKQLMAENGMSDRIIFLNEKPQAQELSFTTAADFPAIYQQALALIYPSIFEGFGLPLIEALHSGLPVISSNTSSLPEVAGDAALYFPPHDHEILSKHMLDVVTNTAIATELRTKGLLQAQKFTSKKHAETVMKVYQSIFQVYTRSNSSSHK